ncbi:MAG: hypothetical protein HY841_10540 [Bacteroidetes bacterium]|nr:hypothetical protein [Bacteroidota bacterium]
MNKFLLGAVAGTILGILDGCSAFFIPEASEMMTEIIIGSTVKGLINGLIAGLIAKKVSSIGLATLFSGITGIILSVLVAIPSGSYMEIIIPGTIVGLLVGAVTAKWGK